MRILVITPLWPSSLEPQWAPFNRQQIGELAKLADLEVISAIPAFPGARLLGRPRRTARLASLPSTETVEGIPTHVMRQLYLPKYGVPIALPLYLASLAPYAPMAARFDVVLSTWAYPDGCAAVLFARALGKPCVVKVHGTDVNVVAKLPVARTVVARVLPHADAVVTVSRALGDELAAFGVPRDRITWVPNGIDAAVFAPRDASAKAEARRALGIADDRKVVLYVGRLEAQKGLAELLASFATVRARIPRALLVLVGEGAGAARRDVDDHALRNPDAFRVVGPQSLAEVARWMAACDLVTLPSHREGTPNVVLEALASGRPVVATAVGGIPEVLDERCGALVPPRDVGALADALASVLTRSWDVGAIARHAPGSWRASAEALYDVLARATLSVRPRAARR